ncbi:AraC family transcriptional regulator [Bremerella sp. P1]|uniref:AraC family transcriptional regulator n=1 Tax=Bremerella sp. P1 TaxID=3026424 RepID=UPI0023680091|nr:AraC family transcriptional regulator [Bremerella sp. P1]WDI43765.1 AraC family transcriptional regulator [Bremerella sp. P1]
MISFNANARKLFDVLPGVSFFIKDQNGRLIYCNSEHRHGLFRYGDPSEIYGRGNYDFFPPTLASTFSADDRDVLNTGRAIWERVELNITKTGVLAWFCTSKIAAKDHNGNVIGIIGVCRKLDKADKRLEDFDLLLPAIEYIEKHQTEPIQVSSLAKCCGMALTTFRREFKLLFRITPVKFLTRLRLHHACTMLNSRTRSVGEIALCCGFNDQNYFTRQFRQVFGMTPTEFREHHGRH